MFDSITVLQFIIFSAGIGIIAAMFYTNLQRSAYSIFITSLIEKECYTKETSISLKDMGLKGIKASIIKSAVKKKYGIGKIVRTIADESEEYANDVDKALSGSCDKYCLEKDIDTDEVMKKYSFDAMSVKKLVLLTVLICAVVFVCSYLAEKIIESASEPDTTEETIEEVTDDDETSKENSENSDGSSDTEETDDVASSNDSEAEPSEDDAENSQVETPINPV